MFKFKGGFMTKKFVWSILVVVYLLFSIVITSNSILAKNKHYGTCDPFGQGTCEIKLESRCGHNHNNCTHEVYLN